MNTARILVFFLVLFGCATLAHAGWVHHSGNWYLWHNDSGVNDGWWYYWDGYRYQRHSQFFKADVADVAAKNLLDAQEKFLFVARAKQRDYERFQALLQQLQVDPRALGFQFGSLYDQVYFNTAQGNTVYSYHSFASPAFDANVAAKSLADLSKALSEGATFTAAEATAAIQAIAESQSKLAESQAHAAFLLELARQAKITQQPAAAGKVERPEFAQVIAKRCVSCHGGDRPAGGLSLVDLSVLTPENKLDIKFRITTADVKLRMPKGGNLAADEIAAIFKGLE